MDPLDSLPVFFKTTKEFPLFTRSAPHVSQQLGWPNACSERTSRSLGSELFSGLGLQQGGVVHREKPDPLVKGQGVIAVQVSLSYVNSHQPNTND